MTTYTAQIEAGNLEQTTWQAVHPSEAVEALDAEEAARVAADNQNIIDAYESVWRILVWAGTDTGSDPVYVLNGEAWLDEQRDLADRARDARTA